MRFFRLLGMALPLAGFLLAQSPSVILNDSASRVLGHPNRSLETLAPNWVEGREMTTPQGIAFDRRPGNVVLYVSDSGNNRILAWKDPLAAANGAPADLVIGQRNRFQSNANGPGTLLTTGLRQPTGLAVDAEGNLWVADSNNNRILRFPKPFDQAPDLLFPDVLIGQETFGSSGSGNLGRLPNRGRDTPASNSLFLSNLSNQIFRCRLAFDTNGNLWVTDAGNHRVLRFPASVLSAGNIGPAADLVLGQLDFNSRVALTGDARDKSRLNAPSGIAWGTDSRLYVSDSRGRVMVYRNPAANAQNADRILGIFVLQQGQAAPPRVNDVQLGLPESLLLVDNHLLVADTVNHRVVRYNPADTWAPETPTAFSPSMRDVIGQPNFNTGDPNRGGVGPSALGFNSPVDAAVLDNNLFVVDGDNHRIIVLPGGAPFSQPGNKLFGQTLFDANGPNLLEGREFFLIGTSAGIIYRGGGMALDGNRLYIADTLNHRILAYQDVRTVQLGQPADLVIGQVSPDRSIPNSPTGRVNAPNQSGLLFPHDVAVDRNGDLWVADSGNGRVLRYPRPFDNATNLQANLVLGQPNFVLSITDPTPRNMSFPVSLAFTSGGNLLVSDLAHNRVLYFIRPDNGDYTNFQAATNVFGQPDLSSAIGSNAQNRLRGPRGIAVDVDDRLYVADSLNNRLQIYDRVPLAGPDASPALSIGGLSNPTGVTADPRTAEIWVANTGTNQAIRFPQFASLSVNPTANLVLRSSVGPLDVQVDSNSNVVVSDSSNRIAFFYQRAAQVNGANFQTTSLAPNTIASLYAQGGSFTQETLVFSSLPLPTTLGNVRVLLNERPMPLFFVSPGQINFFVPDDMPTSGDLEILVEDQLTGQIVGSGTVVMNRVSPGLFTSTATGRGQVSAVNQDGTINSSQNPIPRGQVISLFGTGLGKVSNAPTDGNAAPSGPLAEGLKPDVSFNLLPASSENVLFSGLAPGFVGLWQINVRVPETVPPGNNVPVIVFQNSQPNLAGSGNIVTIAVSQ
ncbi:MAG: hypothetical protein NW208_08250 [Bryobacter sp.]|nr:hypothetical protein [Bryobacter sp.]